MQTEVLVLKLLGVAEWGVYRLGLDTLMGEVGWLRAKEVTRGRGGLMRAESALNRRELLQFDVDVAKALVKVS